MGIALDGLREDNYRIGDLQAIRYDRTKAPFFDGYLGRLYNLCASSKRRSGDGILSTIFGGSPASNFDAIVSYLAQRPIIVMGEWDGDEFKEYGFSFVLMNCGLQAPELSVFAGYGFFQNAWGTENMAILAMLGLAYMFNEFNIQAIHGTRYRENVLTARFMSKFGFKDIGEIPYYHLKNGKLVPAVVSSLVKDDFEEYAEQWLLKAFQIDDELPEYQPIGNRREGEEAPVLDVPKEPPLSWM